MFDDNLLRLLRQQNVFTPEIPENNLPQQNGMGNMPFHPNAMNELDLSEFQPDTRAQDKMFGMINAFPQRNHPSVLRRIVASIAGIGGPNAAEDVLYGKYNNDLADWNSKFKAVDQVANEERYGNTNMRAIAVAAARDKQTTRAQEEKERANLTKEAQNEENIKIRDRRAAAYEYKTMHPNHTFKEDEDGNLIAIDPQTKEATYVMDKDGTPVNTGKMNDMDKINLQIAGRVKVAEIMAANQRKLEDIRSQNDLTQIDKRIAGAKEVKQTPSSSTSGKDELPTQTKVRQYNRARQAAAKPEWSKYVQLGNPGTNDFKLKQPGSGIFNSGPDKKTYDQIYNYIYGSSDQTSKAPQAPKGWKYVPKAGGGWTAVKEGAK